MPDLNDIMLGTLAGKLQQLERVAAAHTAELEAIRAQIKAMETDRINRERFLVRQVTAAREHADVIEQSVANLRNSTSSARRS